MATTQKEYEDLLVGAVVHGHSFPPSSSIHIVPVHPLCSITHYKCHCIFILCLQQSDWLLHTVTCQNYRDNQRCPPPWDIIWKLEVVHTLCLNVVIASLSCIMIRNHNEFMECFDCASAVTVFISRFCSFTQSICAGGENVPSEVTGEYSVCDVQNTVCQSIHGIHLYIYINIQYYNE